MVTPHTRGLVSLGVAWGITALALLAPNVLAALVGLVTFVVGGLVIYGIASSED